MVLLTMYIAHGCHSLCDIAIFDSMQVADLQQRLLMVTVPAAVLRTLLVSVQLMVLVSVLVTVWMPAKALVAVLHPLGMLGRVAHSPYPSSAPPAASDLGPPPSPAAAVAAAAAQSAAELAAGAVGRTVLQTVWHARLPGAHVGRR